MSFINHIIKFNLCKAVFNNQSIEGLLTALRKGVPFKFLEFGNYFNSIFIPALQLALVQTFLRNGNIDYVYMQMFFGLPTLLAACLIKAQSKI